MRKVLSALLLAAVPAIALTACNGQNGTTGVSALPNHPVLGSRLHPHDFSPNDLHAGGATFPAYAYNLGNQPTGLATNGGNPNPQAPPGTGSLFDAAGTTGSIYYCLTGSGTGRKVFNADPTVAGYATAACAPLGASATGFGGRQDPPDFAGTDAAMATSDYTTYKQYREPGSGTSYGEPFEFPVIGGPIVYGFRAKDFPATTGTMRLSKWSVCAMANGTIGNWNDAALTADNGKSLTGGSSQPITYYYRTDSSGTTYNFENWLATNCTATWPAPYNAAPYESGGHSAAWVGTGGITVGTTWLGPTGTVSSGATFTGLNGNPGVLAGVQGTKYGTGYLEGAWAASANPAVAQARVEAGKNAKGKTLYADPNNRITTQKSFTAMAQSEIQYGMGSDGVALATSRPECIMYIPPSKLKTHAAGAYPILAVSYLLFYGHNQGIHTADKIKLIKYLMSPAAATIEKGLEYASLSPGIRKAVLNRVNGTNISGGPCIQ